MKKILAICYYYPPLNSSEGYSAFKLLDYSKYKIDILSQNKFNNWTYSIDDVKSKQPIKYLESKSKKLWFDNITNLPIWKDADVIITRSMPNESHVAGLRIKKQYPKLKWIAFFSDPFFNSPISKWEFKNNNKRFCIKKTIFFYYKNISLWFVQKQIVKHADVLVFNNKFQQEYMLHKHNNKTVIIPHTWSDYKFDDQYKKGDRIVFTFAGDVSRCRNLDNYIDVIKKINLINELKDKVIFQFIGCNKNNIVDILSYENVKIITKISYSKCLLLLNKSDWLINSDAHIHKIIKNYIYLPCKLVDYLSLTSNVLNITNFEQGPTISLVNKCGGVNIKDDATEIFTLIKSIIKNKKYKSKKSDWINNYNNKKVSKDFDNLLDMILC